MTRLRVDGSWPATTAYSRGWSRAVARPWNDDGEDGFVRLERGRADFLRSVSETVAALVPGKVYSPALFPGARRVWAAAGYAEAFRLEVMEKPLGGADNRLHGVDEVADPDWDELSRLDEKAFSGFWRIGAAGLREAAGATRTAIVIKATHQDRLAGYAIVGAQWGSGYLQRVAVDPGLGGMGHGSRLVAGAAAWAGSRGSRAIVLNVRPDNARARRIYERNGFVATKTGLCVMRYEP